MLRSRSVGCSVRCTGGGQPDRLAAASSAAVVGRSSRQPPLQIAYHESDRYRFIDHSDEAIASDETATERHAQLRLHFGARATSDGEVTMEVAIAHTALSFGDIMRDGCGCPTDLAT